MTILQTTALKKIYGTGNTAIHALDGIDFGAMSRKWTLQTEIF